MEHIKINLTNPVYGIREMPIKYIFVENDRLKIIFNEAENYKLNIGEIINFVRYVYNENDVSSTISDNIEVLGFDKYLDDNQYYDCIYTSIPTKKMLTLDQTETTQIVYWDLVNGEYVKTSTPNLDLYEYISSTIDVVNGDYDDLSDEELSEMPQHVYTIEYGIFGIREYNKTYPAGTIPDDEILSEIMEEYFYSDGYEIPEEYQGVDILYFVSEIADDSFGNYAGIDNALDYLINDKNAFSGDLSTTTYIVTFDKNHDIFQQDIDLLKSNEYTSEYFINVYDINLNKIGFFYDIKIPNENNLLPVDKFQTLTEWEEETCGMFDLNGNPYNITYHKYSFSPTEFSKKSVIIGNAETSFVNSSITDTVRTFKKRKIEYLLANGVWFEPAYTPYFYTVSDTNNISCTMWPDIWWDEFNMNNGSIPQTDVWVNSGDTHVALVIDNSYWNVQTFLSSSDEFSSLSTDEDDVYRFINSTIDESLPEIIDFERLKYVPSIITVDNNGDSHAKNVNEIVYKFHFRKRVRVDTPEYANIDQKYRPYEDGWYVNQESGSTIWWNEMEYASQTLTNTAMTDFVLSQSGKSDMLGYLNFTDDDVFFGKSKIKKTFVRFSFYTSKDPVTQKLLFYSTAFLDANELRGKFLKLLTKKGRRPGATEEPFVFTDTSNKEDRIDTTIRITHEYNKNKSSDGFNIYLFLEDAPPENITKTIYMKVEFNHAGNGKTIPMILWPKNSAGNYKKLTVSNFLDSLYIPIQTQYIDNKYVYTIEGWDVFDDRVELTLFEPKLDVLDDIGGPTTGDTWGQVEEENDDII